MVTGNRLEITGLQILLIKSMFVQGLVKTGFIFKGPLKGIERRGIVDLKKEKE